MRYKISLSYDGAPFHGYQIQDGVPTVQGLVQDALSKALRSDISITGAGRTDSGVNAVGYIANFDAAQPIDSREIICKINAILPQGIVVHDIVPAAEDFHSRFDAVQRTYRYFVNRTKDPFVERFSYRFTYPLDVEKMNRAAGKILGTRDFSCFEKTGGSNKTSICTVKEALWETYTPFHARELGYPCKDGDYLVFTISADRFLRNMVRAVVGTLLDIGRGRREEEWMEEVLLSKDRCSAGESVPGNALFLAGITYPNPL